MPKECTHWILAERTKPALPPKEAAAVEAHPHLYLLGAVAPDILFFHKSGRSRLRFRRQAEKLHGVGAADTYAPLKACARRHGDSLPGHVLAFFCGYLTHVAVDSSFHPLVVYYAAESRYFHHALETILDIHFQREGLPPHGRLVRTLLQRVEIDRRELFSLLGCALFCGDPYPEGELVTSLGEYAGTQKFLWNRFAARMVRTFARLHPEVVATSSSYYQPDYYRFQERYGQPIDYCHPVTGASFRETVADIAGRAVERGSGLIAALFDGHGQPGWRDALEGKSGPHLVTGLEVGSPDALVHRAPEGARALFPELVRYGAEADRWAPKPAP